MLSLESLTQDSVCTALGIRDLRLAYAYLNRITNPVRSGQTLTARVQGGSLYAVNITIMPSAIVANCTCSWGSHCKHITAVLLKWLHLPEAFAVGSEIDGQVYPIAVRPVEPPATCRPDQLPAWAETPFDERERAYIQQLAGWLKQVKVQDLRQVAKRRGWRLKGGDKATITRQVAEAMARPEDNLKVALRLDVEHLRALAVLLLLGAKAKAGDIARVFKAWGGSAQQFAGYATELCDVGLALPGLAIDSYTPYSDFCPDAIGRWLLPALSPLMPVTPIPEPGRGRSPAGNLRLADPYPFVRAVSQVALLLEQSPTPLRPPMPRPLLEKQRPGLRGWDYDPAEILRAQQNKQPQAHMDQILTVPLPRPSLPDEAIERLAPAAGDATRLEFIYALLVAAGICQPGSPVTIWPEVRSLFLRRDELAQRAILAWTYFTMATWSELWAMLGTSSLQIKRRANYAHYTVDKLLTDLANCRSLVLRALACLPDNQWIRLEDFFRLLRPAWPNFDEPPHQTVRYYGSASIWFLAQAGSDTRFASDDAHDWGLAQGSFIREMLAGPLHWLGLADLSLDGGALRAFRLHGLADLYWDLVEAPPAPDHSTAAAAGDGSPPVRVDGERIIIRPSAASAQAHGLLERIAHLDAATARHFEYRLEAQAAYRAFEAGLSLGEILAEWQRLLPSPMPETIQAPLTRWWKAYGRVRIYRNLTVIEFADDYALAEMKATTSLGQHIIAEISPRLAIVQQAAVDTLVAELEKAGYTPKRTDQV